MLAGWDLISDYPNDPAQPVWLLAVWGRGATPAQFFRYDSAVTGFRMKDKVDFGFDVECRQALGNSFR